MICDTCKCRRDPIWNGNLRKVESIPDKHNIVIIAFKCNAYKKDYHMPHGRSCRMGCINYLSDGTWHDGKCKSAKSYYDGTIGCQNMLFIESVGCDSFDNGNLEFVVNEDIDTLDKFKIANMRLIIENKAIHNQCFTEQKKLTVIMNYLYKNNIDIYNKIQSWNNEKYMTMYQAIQVENV
jgi:hypothetical protein